MSAETKRSLGLIVREFEALCDEVEQHDLEARDVTELFQGLKGELKDKIDAWIDYLDSLEMYRKHVEEKLEAFKKKRNTLVNLQEKLKNYLLHCMDMTKMPELRGANGTIKVYRNSQPKIDFKMPLEKKSYGHILPYLHADLVKEYPEFLQEISLIVVDAESIKKALLDGRNLDFASLTFGKHVRIR